MGNIITLTERDIFKGMKYIKKTEMIGNDLRRFSGRRIFK